MPKKTSPKFNDPDKPAWTEDMLGAQVVPNKAHYSISLDAGVLALNKSIFSDTLRRMISFERSEEFNAWLLALKDKLGRARIIQRIRSAEHGNFGDCESVGEGVSEMRVHIGPGYRVYFSRRSEVVYLLLVGGDKSSQKRDIKRAIEMARALDKE